MPAIYEISKTHEIKKDKNSMQKFIRKEAARLISLDEIELTFEWIQDELFGWDMAIDVQKDKIMIYELRCIFS